MEIIEKELENKLGLPVVSMQSGTIAVLDKLASRAEMLNKQDALKLLDYSFGKKEKSEAGPNISQNIIKLRQKKRNNKKKVNIKLYFCCLHITSKDAAMAIRKIASGVSNISKIQIFIDAGPGFFEWDRVLKLVENLYHVRGESVIATNIFIDASFSCPNKEHMDFLIKHKVILRYVLGSSLGYSENLYGKDAKALSTVSDYGLRVPVLFYWSGEKTEIVERILRRALELNRLSGIGLLPYFLHPHFDSNSFNNSVRGSAFLEMVNALYANHLFSEFMEEPICDLEDRMSDCNTNNHIRALITDKGRIVPFRTFPFAALYSNSRTSFKTEEIFRLFENPNQLTIYNRCRRCVWKYICGGLDSNRCAPVEQYKTIANIWCKYQKTFMRQIVNECLAIRNFMRERNVR